MRMKPLVALLLGSFVGPALALDTSAITDLIQKGKEAVMGSADDAPIALKPTKPANSAPKASMPSPAAQVAANAQPAAATAAPANATATPAAATGAVADSTVNPFTGAAVSAERSKREADRIRAENLVLEERIKQVSLANDLANAPTKKRIEMENFVETQRKNMPLPLIPAAKPSNPVLEASDVGTDKKKAKASKQTKQATAKSTTPATPPVAMMAPPPVPEVLGVIQTSDGATAILNNGGRTILARPGETSSLGAISEVSGTHVRIGSHNLDFRSGSAVARVQRTDKDATKADQATPAMASRYSLPPIPAAPTQQALPPTIRPAPAAPGVPGPVTAR